MDYSQEDFPYEGITLNDKFVTQPLPHQSRAIEWMSNREELVYKNMRGGLLLDEMGLGKTYSALATSILCGGSTLIIVPAQLVYVWKTEMETHFKDLSMFIYHGTNRKKLLETYRLQNEDPQFLVVSLQSLPNDMQDLNGPLFFLKFHRIIYDECHYFKNVRTRVFTQLEQIKSNVKWFLSGTPIMNRIEEIYPYLRLLEFEEIDQVPRMSLDRKKARVPTSKYLYIQSVLRNVAIRRNKDILDLPSKYFRELFLFQKPDERKFYETLKFYSRKRFQNLFANVQLVNNSGLLPDEQNKLRIIILQNMLSLIFNLRMACCDPLIVIDKIPRTKYLHIQRAIDVLLANQENDCPVCYNDDANVINHSCGHRACKNCWESMKKVKLCFECLGESDMEWVDYTDHVDDTDETSPSMKNYLDQTNHDERILFQSRKTEAIIEKLGFELQKGNKVIIVSQWTSYLDKIYKFFRFRFPDVQSINLDGRIIPKKRQTLVNEFQKNPDIKVCFASLTSTAEGVTLTASCSMILAEPFWNKAKIYQMSDRIHRIGQNKEVNIYCSYMINTIEVKLKELIDKKDVVCKVIVEGKAVTEVAESWLTKMIRLMD